MSLSPSSPTPLGRSGPRSRNGCWTCRTKKVKCDEIRPVCRRCARLKLSCDYAPRLRAFPKGSSAGTFVHSSLDFSRVKPSTRGNVPDESSCGSPRSGSEEISPSLSTAFQWGTYGMELGSEEIEAIQYFRESFSPLYIMKKPQYSAFAIMLRLATHDPLVLHMILAIGGRGIDYRHQWHEKQYCISTKDGPSKYRNLGLKHYSEALRELHTILGDNETAESANLDSLTSGLVLMIMYEQLHGDTRCEGLASHLNGAALIFKHHYADILQRARDTSQSVPLMKTAESGTPRHLSQFCARLITRICGMDATAASFGLGGQVTKVLCRALPESDDKSSLPTGPIKRLSSLHAYSGPLYRLVWGDDYPAVELVHDLENKQLFELLEASVQLRYLTSEMTSLLPVGGSVLAEAARKVETAIHEISETYKHILDFATRLTSAIDDTYSMVLTIRWVVPIYYTEVLDFLRIARTVQPAVELETDSSKTIRNIMNLAFQAYQHGGDVAMVRIARPLFMVALETDEELHVSWILERFKGLAQFGEHFARAGDFLERVSKMRPELRTSIDLRTAFSNQATSICLCLM
ncbi:C6 zinc finger domain protein [Fusarium tjaetaba]|uniref:C6 zinc finger domain protein n=1 Tax=Fusarium tjaetaba TaxID=1567544 RepID=A0A8H5VRZ9_9HYPO|nr:C6 zinc finger domain protein [Fusarium tjaetaba]KAF5631084.1 C6 zinc finger domain protein [Fusarium tjaetaba]